LSLIRVWRAAQALVLECYEPTPPLHEFQIFLMTEIDFLTRNTPKQIQVHHPSRRTEPHWKRGAQLRSSHPRNSNLVSRTRTEFPASGNPEFQTALLNHKAVSRAAQQLKLPNNQPLNSQLHSPALPAARPGPTGKAKPRDCPINAPGTAHTTSA
jgi:hypothetical protein